MKTAAYIRVSKEEQVRDGLSIDAQRDRLQTYCKLRDLHLVEQFVDGGVSGSVPLHKRRAGSDLLKMVAQRQCEAVVAFKLDRIFRSARDCLSVIDKWNCTSIAFHLVDMGGAAIDTSSAMGKFWLTIMAGVAEFERNQISERIKNVMNYKRKRGEWLGGHVPFGWRVVDKRLVEVPEEIAVVERICELRAHGASIRHIAATLAHDGATNRKGNPIMPTQVHRIITAIQLTEGTTDESQTSS